MINEARVSFYSQKIFITEIEDPTEAAEFPYHRESYEAVLNLLLNTFERGTHLVIGKSEDVDRIAAKPGSMIDKEYHQLLYNGPLPLPFEDLFLWYSPRMGTPLKFSVEDHLLHVHRLNSETAYITMAVCSERGEKAFDGKLHFDWDILPIGILMSFNGLISKQPVLPLRDLCMHEKLRDLVVGVKAGRVEDGGLQIVELSKNPLKKEEREELLISHILPAASFLLMGFLKNLKEGKIKQEPCQVETQPIPVPEWDEPMILSPINYRMVSLEN